MSDDFCEKAFAFYERAISLSRVPPADLVFDAGMAAMLSVTYGRHGSLQRAVALRPQILPGSAYLHLMEMAASPADR